MSHIFRKFKRQPTGQPEPTLAHAGSRCSNWTFASDASKSKDQLEGPPQRAARKRSRALSGKFTSSAIAAKNVLSAQVKRFTHAVTGSVTDSDNKSKAVKKSCSNLSASEIQPSLQKRVISFEMDLEGDDEDCRNFVETVTKLGKVKTFEKELVSNVEQILESGSNDQATHIHQAAMQFVGVVLKEAWGSFEDHIKWREEKTAERERVAEEKAVKSNELRRQSVEMMTSSLQEVAMLRDKARGLGEHLKQSCMVTNFEPLKYLDADTRSLVVTMVEEKLKGIVAEADNENAETILGAMVQDKLHKATSPLQARIANMEVENFDLSCKKGFLETEIDELKKGRESFAEAMEKAHQETDEALRLSRSLRNSKEETEMKLLIAMQESERMTLELEQARQERNEALEALASAPSASSSIGATKVQSDRRMLQFMSKGALQETPESQEELQFMSKGALIREAVTLGVDDAALEVAGETSKEAVIELIMQTLAAKSQAKQYSRNELLSKSKGALIKEAVIAGVEDAALAVAGESSKEAVIDLIMETQATSTHTTPVSRDELQVMSMEVVIKTAMAMRVEDGALKAAREISKEAVIELIMETQSSRPITCKDEDEEEGANKRESSEEMASFAQNHTETESLADPRATRPILPGAAVTVQLAHAQQLHSLLEATPGKAVDLIAVLSEIGTKVVDEFSEIVSSIEQRDALKHYASRLDITRRETNAVRRLCAVLLEDLVALHNLLQGGGQSQHKLGMALKRLASTMQALRAHFSSSCFAAQYSVEHLEELRRFGAKQRSQQQEAHQEPNKTAAEDSDQPSIMSQDDGRSTWGHPSVTSQDHGRPTFGSNCDEKENARSMSIRSIGTESMDGSSHGTPKVPNPSGSSVNLPTLRRGSQTCHKAELGLDLTDRSISGGIQREVSGGAPSLPRYSSGGSQFSGSLATPKATSSTMTLALEEPAVTLRTPRSKDCGAEKTGLVRRSSASSFGPKKNTNPAAKVPVHDSTLPILPSPSNASAKAVSSIGVTSHSRRSSM